MDEQIRKLCKTTRSFLESGNEIKDLNPDLKNQWIEFLNDNNPDKKENLFNKKENLFNRFESHIGSMVFQSVLDSAIEEEGDKFMSVLKKKFTDVSDKRCQVGQVYSHMEKYNYEKADLFRKNVNSVFLIIDKKGLTFNSTDRDDYVGIDSGECSNLVGFRSEVTPGSLLKLCESFHYLKDRIPAKGRIFGTGVMIAPDKIATAAHIVYEAHVAGVNPLDLIFIGAHFVYGDKDRIEVNGNNIYQLNQEKIMINNRMVNGKSGDSAWLEVEPFSETSQRRNASSDPRFVSVKIPDLQLMKKEQPVYALGHGFGVPMKLSFGGTMEYLGEDGWMGCNLDIFPGNSGSPVFHANTHELLGIVSGPDNLWRKEDQNGHCMNVKINNDRGQSVETSQIQFLIQKIQNQ